MFSVIFDMDGTLLDTQRIGIPAWEYAGKNQGINGMGEEILRVSGMNTQGIICYLKENYPNLDIERFQREKRQYIIENQNVRYKAGAKELLDFLKAKGIKMALASGSTRESIMHHLQQLDATEYFSAIVGDSDVSFGKPAPDIFLLAAKLLGEKSENCFVFEDSVNGIMAASAAGMRCFGIPDVAQFSEDVKARLFAYLTSIDRAIPILEREIENEGE